MKCSAQAWSILKVGPSDFVSNIDPKELLRTMQNGQHIQSHELFQSWVKISIEWGKALKIMPERIQFRRFVT